jgi:hypothetical protein
MPELSGHLPEGSAPDKFVNRGDPPTGVSQACLLDEPE